jgi:hypothetical protein
VPGLGRQHPRGDPDLLQRAKILLLDIAAEDEILISRAMQPAIALDFVFQLARRPAGIAQRENRVLGSTTIGDGAQECSTKPRPVSTGPPFSTFMLSALSGSLMLSDFSMMSS